MKKEALQFSTCALFFIVSHSDAFANGGMNNSLNAVRQLAIAIYVYHSDYLAGTKPELQTPYPATLQDLVEPGYLDERDLKKLTSIPLEYFPPSTEEADPNIPFLIAHSHQGVFAGFPSMEARLIAPGLKPLHDPVWTLFFITSPFAIIIAIILLYRRKNST